MSTSPRLRARLAATAGLYTVNVGKIPVRAVLDRLKVAAVTALTATGEKLDDADATLQAVYDANKMALQRRRLYRNTLVYGDSYLFVWRGDTDPVTRIHYNSPVTTRLVYDPDDELTALYGIKAWKTEGRWQATLYYPDHVEPGWYMAEGKTDPEDPTGWVRSADSSGGRDIPTPDEMIPLVHFRTDLPYGTPVHSDAAGPQGALNKMSRSMTDTAESAGFPARYGLMEPNAELAGEGMDSPGWEDDLDTPDGASSSDDNQYRARAGEIALLRGLKQVGTFDAAEPKGFIEPSDWYLQALSVVTGVPARYLTGRGDTPSGAALRVADAPLQAMVETTQAFLDDSEREVGERILGLEGVEGFAVDVRWKPAGIVDDVTTWDIAKAKIDTGVPVRTALAETGLYDQDEIDGWLADASVEMDVTRRIGLLSEVAAALQGLSAGVAQGILDEQSARAVVAVTIGQLTPEVEAAQAPVEPGGMSAAAAEATKAKADALGTLVRSGVDPKVAAGQVGLDLAEGDFLPDVFPVTLHQPKADQGPVKQQ